MDFLLAMVLSFGIFVGYNAQPAGNLNFACRNGEEYDMCRSPCEATCNSIRLNCSQSCVAGCFCREGLVRANDRTCIPPEECQRRIIPSCKENEEYRECGSPCVANCSNMNDPIFCTKPCHSGCFCKQDFIRDSMGKCVHPRNCYTAGYGQCPVHEHYVNCINFCNTCVENADCRNRHCTPGCDCKPGYYRNFYGQCVPAEECHGPFYDSLYPSLRGYCGENEIYSDCVNLCNDCVSKGRCNVEFYCEPGCDCKPGFFRDERGVCVPERFCSRRCNEDQVFSDCGPSCVSTCQNYRRLLYHPCKQQCVPGCFCPRNLVLGPSGKCIQPHYCPAERPACPPDEKYYTCIPTCRATCDSFRDSTVICDTSCTPGCFCKTGLVRRDDGKCVPYRDCAARSPTCPPGEAFYQCLPTCRTSCDTLRVSGGICSTECRPGCFCQPGFVRNEDGRCIRPRECPNLTTPERVPFDARRGGTDGDDTTTTPELSAENNQSVTDKRNLNDSQNISSSAVATTNPVTAASDSPPTTTDKKPQASTKPILTETSTIPNERSASTIQTERSALAESTNPTENSTLAESSTNPTDKSALAESSTIRTENSALAESSTIRTENSTLAESSTNSTENSALATESSALVESSTILTKSSVAGVTSLAETVKTETNDGQTGATISEVTITHT